MLSVAQNSHELLSRRFSICEEIRPRTLSSATGIMPRGPALANRNMQADTSGSAQDASRTWCGTSGRQGDTNRYTLNPDATIGILHQAPPPAARPRCRPTLPLLWFLHPLPLMVRQSIWYRTKHSIDRSECSLYPLTTTIRHTVSPTPHRSYDTNVFAGRVAVDRRGQRHGMAIPAPRGGVVYLVVLTVLARNTTR